MQYRNIALKGDNEERISLIKYQEKYQADVQKLAKQNAKLAYILAFNDWEEMAYLVLEGLKCRGGILISAACEPQNINVEITLDDNLSNDKIFALVDTIVSSLGWYFYDKENIIITLTNGLDLTTFNRQKYERKPLSKGTMIYRFHNRNYRLMTLLTAKMQETQDNLLNSENYWHELAEFSMPAYLDEDLVLDKKYIYPLEEAFYSASKVTWDINSSNKNKRKIIFQKDGKIEFVKESLKDPNLSYRVSSWVDQDHFCYKNTSLKMSLESIPDLTIMNYDKIQIVSDKGNNTKQYRYVSSDKKSKIEMELLLNGLIFQNFVMVMDTYNDDYTVESEYIFEFSLKDNKYSFRRIAYEGTTDLIPLLKEEDKVLLFNIKKGNLPVDKLDKTIQRLVKIINEYASQNDLTLMGYENLVSVQEILTAEDKIVDQIKGISGEILVPCIKEKMQSYLQNKDKGKVKYLTRSRSLKNQERE